MWFLEARAAGEPSGEQPVGADLTSAGAPAFGANGLEDVAGAGGEGEQQPIVGAGAAAAVSEEGFVPPLPAAFAEGGGG